MIKVRSIRFKISVLYVAILGLILFVYSTVLCVSLRQILYHDLDRSLRIKTQEVEDLLNSTIRTFADAAASVQIVSNRVILRRGIRHTTTDPLERRILQMLDKYEMRDDYVALLKATGEPVSFSGNISRDLLRNFSFELVRQGPQQKSTIRTSAFGPQRLRLITRPVRLADGNSYAILVATSLKTVDRTTKRLLGVILFSMPFFILLASSVGSWLVTGILGPVQAVSKKAEEITHDNLSIRVQAGDADDEMQHLAGAFNGMIERLEKSFRHISDFSSHVAHELKTPLAVIRGEAEIALKKERTGAEYQEALKANLHEAQRMTHVIEDMLFLARLDYDPGEVGFERVDLAQFLEDIAEKARILADPKKIEVVFKSELSSGVILGDEVHLRRLFLNILDNAVKFTPEGGRITLGLRKEQDKLVTSVTDTGPGISEADLPKIFDKFFHKNQPGVTPGTGLGLSIVQSIARAYKGDVWVLSRLGQGTTFEVLLPAAK